MGRRERYIPLTDAELRRLEEEHVAKQKLVENRKSLIAKTLRSQRKDSLVQVLIKLCWHRTDPTVRPTGQATAEGSRT